MSDRQRSALRLLLSPGRLEISTASDPDKRAHTQVHQTHRVGHLDTPAV